MDLETEAQLEWGIMLSLLEWILGPDSAGMGPLMAKRKQYSTQFKTQVVLELLKEKTVGKLSSEHGIHLSLFWRAEP